MSLQTMFVFLVAAVVFHEAVGKKMGMGVGTQIEVCPISGRPCPKKCSGIYKPVCATLRTRYTNLCFMNAAQCMLKKVGLLPPDEEDVSLVSRSSEFNPLSAFKGKNVAKRMAGMVESGCPHNACTMESSPLHAYYTASFNTQCLMDAAICSLECELNQGFYVTVLTKGRCPGEEKDA